MKALARDENIQQLVKSWNPAAKWLLILAAFFATTLVVNLIWRFIWYFSTFIKNGQGLYDLITEVLYYLFLYNVRFGGFILFCLFLIWNKGRIANIVLASPAGYKKIEINNVYLRCLVYLLAIIIAGFVFQGFRYLFGFSPAILLFKTSFWDFVVVTFFTPISEEIYYRFLLIYIIGSALGRTTGIALSLFLFILSHDYSQIGITGIIWVASLALINTILVISLGSLWPAIAFHSINNTLAYFSRPF